VGRASRKRAQIGGECRERRLLKRFGIAGSDADRHLSVNWSSATMEALQVPVFEVVSRVEAFIRPFGDVEAFMRVSKAEKRAECESQLRAVPGLFELELVTQQFDPSSGWTHQRRKCPGSPCRVRRLFSRGTVHRPIGGVNALIGSERANRNPNGRTRCAIERRARSLSIRGMQERRRISALNRLRDRGNVWCR
jgi:hypothetical protein